MQKLRPIEYHEPQSLREASELLLAAGPAARILAGGTDILVILRRGKVNGATLVNIKKIPGLRGIEKLSEGGFKIGALTLVSELETANLPGCAVLNSAAQVLGHRSIRNLATIGGNIGRASPASEFSSPLLVLGAEVLVFGPDGERVIPISDFFVGPGKTALLAGEIISAFKIPPQQDSKGWYMREGRTCGSDCAQAGVAVQFRLDGKTIIDPRVALTAVGPTPMLSPSAEKALRGKKGSAAVFRAVATAAAKDARPLTDFRASAQYRLDLVRYLAERALTTAFEQ